MWELLGITLFLLLIMLSIALHEIGHLVPAKKFGVRVSEYMVGFGPTIKSWGRGETRYGIKVFPLGGYIRMIGMLPPPKDAPEGTARSFSTGRTASLIQSAREQSLEEIAPGDEDRVFYRLPPWKRIVIMMGGPLMNLVLAVILFTIVVSGVGSASPTLTVHTVAPCVPSSDGMLAPTGQSPSDCPSGYSPAWQAGLQTGDIITGFNGRTPTGWGDVNAWIRESAGKEVTLQFRRGTELETSTVTFPQVVRTEYVNGSPQQVTTGFLGVRPDVEFTPQPVTAVPGVIWGMVQRAANGIVTLPIRFYELSTETLLGGQERSPESPVSVVGASRLGGDVLASENEGLMKVNMFLGLAASVNLFLFMFNLLPILPLDGGHVAGAIYEAARKRVYRMFGKPDPGYVDTAKLLPVAYVAAAAMLVLGSVVIFADIVKPLTLG